MSDLHDLLSRGLRRSERLLLILYYYEGMTMKEIGGVLDLPESRVRQMHSSIFSRLSDGAGGDLVKCAEFAAALCAYAENHPVPQEKVALYAAYHLNGQGTIKRVEPDKLILEGMLDGDDDITISLPGSVTGKARTGWSVMLELVRIEGKWCVLGVGNVHP